MLQTMLLTRCSVRLYLQLIVVELVSYLCLLAYRGVFCIFFVFVLCLVYQMRPVSKQRTEHYIIFPIMLRRTLRTRCSVRLYLQFIVAGLVFYLCLLPYRGVFVILFIFVMCLVYHVLPVSLVCPFVIALSVFSNVYLPYNNTRKIMTKE